MNVIIVQNCLYHAGKIDMLSTHDSLANWLRHNAPANKKIGKINHLCTNKGI